MFLSFTAWRPNPSSTGITAGAVEGILSILGRTPKTTGKEEDFEKDLQALLDGHVSDMNCTEGKNVQRNGSVSSPRMTLLILPNRTFIL